MFWTIMPLEIVFEGSDLPPLYVEIPWRNGGSLMVEEIGHNQARVVRLISTNPSDYLDPAVQPGSIIHYKAESQA